MKDYLTVNEYAAENGMTHQAVYKSIKAGKVVTEERTIDGKRRKVVVVDRVQTDDPPTNQEDGSDNRQPAPKVATAGNDEVSALEKAVEALTQQLAEKDRQIANLMQLLHNQQELQAHNQMLLSQPEADAVKDPQIIEAPTEEKPKRRGFWSWLFE